MAIIWSPSHLHPDTCWHAQLGGWLDLSVFEREDGMWKASVQCHVLPGEINNMQGAQAFAEDKAKEMLEKALADLGD